MKKYDLVSILRPTTEDNTVDEIHKNITEIITSNGGKVEEQGVWKKRKLAYQIDTFDEGIYTITTFEGPANLPNELDRVLKISDDVIIQQIAIINSMTKKERADPNIIKASRKIRISNGSGTRVQDVNKLLKQFLQSQKMMKKMKSMGTGGMPNDLLQKLQGNLPPNYHN